MLRTLRTVATVVAILLTVASAVPSNPSKITIRDDDTVLPLVVVHGWFGTNTTMGLEILFDRIQTAFPSIVIHSVNVETKLHSLEPLETQLPIWEQAIRDLPMAPQQRYNLLGFSQGGLLASLLARSLDDPRLSTVISLAGPLMGTFGVPIGLQKLVPKVAVNDLWKLLYTPEAQRLTSFANLWHDPMHQSEYLQQSLVLPVFNNEIESVSPAAKQRTHNWKALSRFVAVAGPDDGVIEPWQSSHFAFFQVTNETMVLNDDDSNDRVVPMEEQNIYIKDTFGLRTLSEEGKLTLCTVEAGVHHEDFPKDVGVFERCVRPFLGQTDISDITDSKEMVDFDGKETLDSDGNDAPRNVYVNGDTGVDSPTQAGTQASPFKTVSYCLQRVSTMSPPPTATDRIQCVLASGDYVIDEALDIPSYTSLVSETVLGDPSDGGGPVRLLGTASIDPQSWTACPPKRPGQTFNLPDHVVCAQIPGTVPIEQLFYDGNNVPEARWPNLNGSHVLDRSTWAHTSVGSRYGRVISDELAASGVIVDSAIATLNVAHQFYTWTRRARQTRSQRSTGMFTYSKDLPGITSFANKTLPWEHNRFYVSGSLALLDEDGEWFFDEMTRWLYFVNPDQDKSPETLSGESSRDLTGARARARARLSPPSRTVSYKRIPYCVTSSNTVDVRVDGISFLGCTFHLHGVNHSLVANVDLSFPSFNRTIPEMCVGRDHGIAPSTTVNGNDNLLVNLTLRNSSNSGLVLSGDGHSVDNVLIVSTGWVGSLQYPPLQVGGNSTTVTRSTVAYFGNAGVVTHGSFNVVSYTHIHHGGLTGNDTALLYTGSPTAHGTVWHHNWVHDGSEKCVRGDDQTRNLTVHHCVIFRCGHLPGQVNGFATVIKGDNNTVYHNTIFNAGRVGMLDFSSPEPDKPFRHQWPLLKVQNNHSLFLNNAAFPWAGDIGKPTQYAPGGRLLADFMTGDPEQYLVNPNPPTDAGADFRPRQGTPLIGKGANIPPYTPSSGSIDIGAYQYDQPIWKPGCTLPACAAYN